MTTRKETAKINLNQFFQLVENKVLTSEQGEILFNNFLTGSNNELPYVYKSQIEQFKKIGVSIN